MQTVLTLYDLEMGEILLKIVWLISHWQDQLNSLQKATDYRN